MDKKHIASAGTFLIQRMVIDMVLALPRRHWLCGFVQGVAAQASLLQGRSRPPGIKRVRDEALGNGRLSA